MGHFFLIIISKERIEPRAVDPKSRLNGTVSHIVRSYSSFGFDLSHKNEWSTKHTKVTGHSPNYHLFSFVNYLLFNKSLRTTSKVRFPFRDDRGLSTTLVYSTPVRYGDHSIPILWFFIVSFRSESQNT